jgi:hypothetical protein
MSTTPYACFASAFKLALILPHFSRFPLGIFAGLAQFVGLMPVQKYEAAELEGQMASLSGHHAACSRLEECTKLEFHTGKPETNPRGS